MCRTLDETEFNGNFFSIYFFLHTANACQIKRTLRQYLLIGTEKEEEKIAYNYTFHSKRAVVQT